MATESTIVTLYKEEEEKWILLKVQGQKEPHQLCYLMGRKTPLTELRSDYGNRIGIHMLYKTFLYKGDSMDSMKSADDLEMKDEDVIEVIGWNKFISCWWENQSTSTTITLPRAEKEKPIVLRVREFTEDDQLLYRIGRNTPLEKLMADYTRRMGVAFHSKRFLYDGSCIDPKKTAADLEMEDEEMIQVDGSNKFTVAKATQSTLISLPREDDEKPVVLIVHNSTKYHLLFYCIGRKTPLHKLMFDYSTRYAALMEHLTLSYSEKDIKPNDTADGMKIEDGSIIRAAFYE